MSQAESKCVASLQSVEELLTNAASDDREAVLQAGVSLEEVAHQLPGDAPGVEKLLGLALDTLQAVYTGEQPFEPALNLISEAVVAIVAHLTSDGEGDAEAIDCASDGLRKLLAGDSDSSPSDGEDAHSSTEPHCIESSIEDRLSVLVGLEPEDVPELANLAAWLIEQAESPEVNEEIRAHAQRAEQLIRSVLEGEAADPGQALDEAAAQLHSMTLSGGDGSSDPGCDDPDGERTPPPDNEPDGGPLCLEFEGDPVLIGEFVTESLEHLEAAEIGMLSMEADPNDREAINAIFRGFHTVKGTAGFLGLAHIQTLAHHAENLLDQVRNGSIELTGHYADLALASLDMLRRMLEDLHRWEEGDLPPPPPGYNRLIELLEAPEDHGTDSPPDVPRAQKCAPEDDETTASEQSAEGGTWTPGTDGDRRVGSTRVRTDRLDALINMVGELVIANSMLAQDEELRNAVGQEVERKIDQISKITRELQDVSMSLRMVPLKGTFHKMARVVRDVARKSGKQIELVTDGDDTEIDRNMVESITDPLMHMVRNAADHGIEPPEERRAAEKDPTGTITLRAYHSAASVVIEIADDGRGLDRDRIYDRAVDAGEIEAGAEVSDEEIYRLIFSSGLSTAKEVTDVSGRGVGMDVVRRNIETMRGRVDISSESGRGSTFSIRIPLTLAIIDGMLMRVGEERYILPTVSIQQAFRPRADDLRTLASAAEMVRFRSEMIPLLRMNDLFGIESEAEDLGQDIAVVVEREGERFALLVDELLGQQQVVIKTLGEGLADAETVAGAAILGDGSVGLILDVDSLIRVAQNVQRGQAGDSRCAV